MIYSWPSLERAMNMSAVAGGELGGPCGRPAARPLPTSSPANPLGQAPVLRGCFLGISCTRWATLSPVPGPPLSPALALSCPVGLTLSTSEAHTGSRVAPGTPWAPRECPEVL